MYLIKEPVDKFVRIVMLIVVKEGIGSFQSKDEALMTECSTRLFICCHFLEKIVQLVQHILLASIGIRSVICICGVSFFCIL